MQSKVIHLFILNVFIIFCNAALKPNLCSAVQFSINTRTIKNIIHFQSCVLLKSIHIFL
jgi:hypothetical protein